MNSDLPAPRRFSVFQGVLPIRREQVMGDVLAGVTLAALGIPEVMGYTKISLTPVVTGLYTLLVPMLAFALLGSSRHLAVAADSATAAILAGFLVKYAAPFSPEYVALTGFMAISCAGFLLVARILRLGFLADFLSRSALVGFLTGVGIQVSFGEFHSLLGIPKHFHSTVGMIWETLLHLDATHVSTAILSGVVLAVILGFGRVAPRFPAALLAVIGSMVASAMFHLERFGIDTIGAVPSGLPHLALPNVNWSLAPALAATAASCAIVIIAQSAATSRSYALRYSEDFDSNRDMVGLAAANFGAACSGTFIVNGSPTKTEMVDFAGGRSQIAQLTTAAIVLLVLLFLTRPLSFMPSAVLSAVVFLIGVKLVDVKGLRDLYAKRRDEFWIAVVTALAVVFIGVEQGILLAIGISLVDHLRRSYRPTTALLVPDPQHGGFHQVAPASDQMAMQGLMIYRFPAPLYYANAGFFMAEVLSLVKKAPTPVWRFIVRFDSIADIDYSSARMLEELARLMKRFDVDLVFADVGSDMAHLLDRYGLTQALGQGRIFGSIDAALVDYKPAQSRKEQGRDPGPSQ